MEIFIFIIISKSSKKKFTNGFLLNLYLKGKKLEQQQYIIKDKYNKQNAEII